MADRRGVFAQPAFMETFGLTVIEASATGSPFVATHDGGPQDIVENCRSGLIVDVRDREALTGAMLQLLTDPHAWNDRSTNGVNRVREYYSWPTHCARYLECLKDVVTTPVETPSAVGRTAPGTRLAALDSLLITDIDNTLLGDDVALVELKAVIHENRHRMGFGVASGRALELVNQVLAAHHITEIDVVVAAVGSEIYYAGERMLDKGWVSQLRSKWYPDRIRGALDPLPFLQVQQEPHTQREFKISYDLDDGCDADDALARIHEALARAKAAYSLIFSHGTFIDILPHRASKGKAVRYLAGKWNIPLERVATAGDSGNDRDMLIGQTAGIVVGNHDAELASLRRSTTHRVYFAEAHCAGGILEGLRHYGFVDSPAPAVA